MLHHQPVVRASTRTRAIASLLCDDDPVFCDYSRSDGSTHACTCAYVCVCVCVCVRVYESEHAGTHRARLLASHLCRTCGETNPAKIAFYLAARVDGGSVRLAKVESAVDFRHADSWISRVGKTRADERTKHSRERSDRFSRFRVETSSSFADESRTRFPPRANPSTRKRTRHRTTLERIDTRDSRRRREIGRRDTCDCSRQAESIGQYALAVGRFVIY